LYVEAVEEMLDRTDRRRARWHLIAAESKRYARVEVVRTVNEEIEAGMRRWGQEPPPPP
jgi:polyphosphate kinase 2 (PPK2 family)